MKKRAKMMKTPKQMVKKSKTKTVKKTPTHLMPMKAQKKTVKMVLKSLIRSNQKLRKTKKANMLVFQFNS